VVGLNNSANTIQAGSWISIFGSNLAPTPTLWTGDFPTALGGTSVTINGKAGYLWFVSPEQINLQAPDDATLGPVEVRVTTATGSALSVVNLAQASPSFNLIDGKHVAGTLMRPSGGYEIVGPTGTSLGYATMAAKAGDTLVLYGVGFGPTNPPVAAGRKWSGAAEALNSVQFVINGRMIVPDWAGISAAGLFQFNLTIPPGLGTGDQPVQALVNGKITPPGTVLALQ
jgi:uncharacterized protein (TIGR03437 family)